MNADLASFTILRSLSRFSCSVGAERVMVPPWFEITVVAGSPIMPFILSLTNGVPRRHTIAVRPAAAVVVVIAALVIASGGIVVLSVVVIPRRVNHPVMMNVFDLTACQKRK